MDPAEQPSVPPPVVAVVVTHDAPAERFVQVLDALAAQDHPNLDVLVVDTGTIDPTERVLSVLPPARVHRVEGNPGFGAAANVVLDMVSGAEFYVFCHDDAAPDPGAVRALVDAAQRWDADVVGPKLVAWDDRHRFAQFGVTVDRIGVALPMVQRGELDQGQHDGARDVFAVPGAFTLVRASRFAEVGGFDEAINYLGDDISLSWRARLAGARVLVTSAARVRHAEAFGERPLGREAAALQARHRLRLVLTSYRPGSLLRVIPEALVLSLAEVLAALVSALDEPLAEVVTAYEALLPRLEALASQGADTAIGAPLVQDLAASDAATKATFAADGELADDLNRRIADQRAEVDRLRQQAVWAMIASLVAALVAAAAGIHLVTSGIVRRIEQHAANTARFIRGEAVEAVTSSRDEIGQFDDSISYAAELLEARRAEALAATRAKDEFLSRVSHELKTPLTAIVGFAQLLEESPDLPPDHRQDASEIVRGAGHLLELIEELLDIKAIEAGRLSLSIEAVPLPQTADDAVAVVRRMADDRSIVITADCPADVMVAADRRRLREVLLNLLSNAVKYNREGGRVELAADRRDGTVHVTVTDTGPGIGPEDREHVFEPFERLAAATGTEGSGVGLSLAKHVVEAMGGTIGVDSEVGEGSTFWFDLPAAEPTTGAPPGRAGTDPALGTS